MSRRSLFAILLLVAVGMASPDIREASAGNGCTPRSRDSDHDRIPDCWERRNGLRVGSKDGHTDKDRDSLTARQEYLIDLWSTDDSLFLPYRADDPYSIRPKDFVDGYEDLDGDGFFNAAEFTWGTDPLDGTSLPLLPAAGCITVPDRVPSDGSTNVTRQLQTVIDTVPDGRCLELAAGARYRSNGRLKIYERHDFTVFGNGASLFTNKAGQVVYTDDADHSHRQHLWIAGGSNITVEDLLINGPNEKGTYVAVLEFEAGVKVSGTQGAVLRDLRIKETHGDFVQVSDWDTTSGPVPARDVLITGGNFDRAGRVAVDLSEGGEDIVIDGNSFDGTARSGITLEMLPNKHINGLVVSNNTFSDIGFFWAGASGRGTATDVSFIGNQLIGETIRTKVGTERGSGLRHTNWTFDSNVSDTYLRGNTPIFDLRSVDGFVVVGNVQAFYPGNDGIVFEIEDVCDVTVGENSFEGWAVLFAPEPPTC